MKKFLEVFEGIKLDAFEAKEKKIIEAINLSEINLYQKKRRCELTLLLPCFVSMDFLVKLKESIQRFLDYPVFIDIVLIEKYDKYQGKSLEEIYPAFESYMIDILAHDDNVLANMLKNAETKVEGNSLKYYLAKLSYEYLNNYRLTSKIMDIYKSKFGIDIKCSLHREEELELVLKNHKEERDKDYQEILEKKVKDIKTSEIKKDFKLEKGLLIGKGKIKTDITAIKQVEDNGKNFTIRGRLIGGVDKRDTRTGKTIIKLTLADNTGVIIAKTFLEKSDMVEELVNEIKKAPSLLMEGKYQYDSFDKNQQFNFKKLASGGQLSLAEKKDSYEEKRVELHCHTLMSEMESIISTSELVKYLSELGHKAVALADTGVVLSFPEIIKDIKGIEDFKPIYGMQANIVDDQRPIYYGDPNKKLEDSTYVVYDIETTGFVPGQDAITEIGAVKVEKGRIVGEYSVFVNPQMPIPIKIQELTKITNQMVENERTIEEILPEFLEFSRGAVLVAQNADFDMSFIDYYIKKFDMNIKFDYIDTLEIARHLFPDLKNYRLNTLAEFLSVKLYNHHRAVYDAQATAEIFIKMLEILTHKGLNKFEDLDQFAIDNPINYTKAYPYHALLIVVNQLGMKNLYELVSESHINTFFREPRILKTKLNELRQGILVGTTGGRNDFYSAVSENRTSEHIDRLAAFYDFFSIHPNEVARYFSNTEKVKDNKGFERINKKIIQIGEELNKPVVVTGDVKILRPQDEIYLKIMKAGKKLPHPDKPAPFYFRTTDELMEEFDYLGFEKAKEIVITNTNMIADKTENVYPISPRKCPPVIEGSDDELRKLCYFKAHKLYGEKLPTILKERLDKELNSIISNNYSVLYIISHKLVKKSNEDGYLVGSRGSVGSSLVAMMSDITEVNPLPAHYRCGKCKYSEFESKEIIENKDDVGLDLPDKKCPECGEWLIKDGYNIPFETFLGFDGDKEPDIDLNFSPDYQPIAHKYTEELFGTDNVFRAGTIGTMKDKTAFGFVKNYFEERDIVQTPAEINYHVSKLLGVRRSAGQHPGGLVILPKGENIYEFTPIQRPSNAKSDTITTHFNYHSIDSNLLKLDILGHDDPTMIYLIEELTNTKITDIPLKDPKALSLFKSKDALNYKYDVPEIKLGCLGIPEFGTDFVFQMLLEAKPETFTDLIRISGLSHGTDVWNNNSQTLIAEGKADLSTVISIRDDIMGYLISKGIDKSLSFKITESVRKGKKLRPEWEKIMLEANIPDWYIWSCNKIQYLFPKAHATAYVMMACRIAYYKIYYPLEYYAAYLTIRASDFDYEIMGFGAEQMLEHEKEIKAKGWEMTSKEEDMLKEIRFLKEMYARGFEFINIDIYKAEAKRFIIDKGKIMPSLMSINGMGEKAAESIVEARKERPFLSIEDLLSRTALTGTIIDIMKKNEIIKGLPQSNQMSLFDLL